MSVESWEMRKEGAWMGVCINLVPQNCLTYRLQTSYWNWKQKKITRALAATFVNETTIELGEHANPYKETKRRKEQTRRKILLSKQQRLERRIVLCTLKRNQERCEIGRQDQQQGDNGSERKQRGSTEVNQDDEVCELRWTFLKQSVKKPAGPREKKSEEEKEEESEQGEESQCIMSSGSVTVNIPEDDWQSDWNDDDEDDMWSQDGDYNSTATSSVTSRKVETPKIFVKGKASMMRNTTTVERGGEVVCPDSAMNSQGDNKDLSPRDAWEERGERKIKISPEESLELHLKTWIGHRRLTKLIRLISMTYGTEIAIETRCFIEDKEVKVQRLQEKRKMLMEKIQQRRKVHSEREGKPWFVRLYLMFAMLVCSANIVSP